MKTRSEVMLNKDHFTGSERLCLVIKCKYGRETRTARNWRNHHSAVYSRIGRNAKTTSFAEWLLLGFFKFSKFWYYQEPVEKSVAKFEEWKVQYKLNYRQFDNDFNEQFVPFEEVSRFASANRPNQGEQSTVWQYGKQWQQVRICFKYLKYQKYLKWSKTDPIGFGKHAIFEYATNPTV